DLWVSNYNGNMISRVRASDGKLLETWTGPINPAGLRVAMGRVVVAGSAQPGTLSTIDPSQPVGSVTLVASNLPPFPNGLAFDGSRFWTANLGSPASVSIVTPGASIPWTVTTVTTGFTGPVGALFDGTNVWITDAPNKLLKLDPAGAVLLTVTVGSGTRHPIYDGTNIWVPSDGADSGSVLRPGNGAPISPLTGHRPSAP